MPYKDPTVRRDFQRRYKRKLRAGQAKNLPFKGVKIYLCLRIPDLRMPGASFRDSFLITADPKVKARVERHREFGRSIFPLALDLTCAPSEDEEE